MATSPDGVTTGEAPSPTEAERADLIAVADYLENDGCMAVRDVPRRVELLRRIAGAAPCEACNGRGEVGGFQGGDAPGFVTEQCERCHGTGWWTPPGRNPEPCGEEPEPNSDGHSCEAATDPAQGCCTLCGRRADGVLVMSEERIRQHATDWGIEHVRAIPFAQAILAEATGGASGQSDADYVCPQCGPDPRGPDAHARERHEWPGTGIQQAQIAQRLQEIHEAITEAWDKGFTAPRVSALLQKVNAARGLGGNADGSPR